MKLDKGYAPVLVLTAALTFGKPCQISADAYRTHKKDVTRMM